MKQTLLCTQLVISIALFVAADRTSVGSLFKKSQCIKIPRSFGFCHSSQHAGASYNETRLPNLLGQDTIDEIAGLLPAWDPLLKINCNPKLALFLCSLYAPMCLNMAVYVEPCRELCESVQRDCGPVMAQFGHDWPEKMSCDKFPRRDKGMCLLGSEANESKPEEQTCKACRKLETVEAWLFRLCRAQWVIKGKVSTMRNYGKNHVMISLRKKHKVLRSTTKLSGKQLPLNQLTNYRVRHIQDCRCDALKGAAKKRSHLFFIQPHRSRKELYAFSIVKFPRKNSSFKKAIQKINADGGCDVVMRKYHARKG